MKNTWYIAAIALLTTGSVAFGDSDSVVPATTPKSATAVTTTKKISWVRGDSVSRRLVEKGVPNFGKLNEDIWRSGQPTAEGYKALAAQGLKAVVNLRGEFPQDKRLMPDGVKYYYIPIPDQHAPTPEQAKKFLEIASNPDNWPLLVHCQGGEGRAGVMSALVRRTLDGWDYDKAMKEVGNFRIKHLGLFSTAMPACQRKFIQDWQEAGESRP